MRRKTVKPFQIGDKVRVNPRYEYGNQFANKQMIVREIKWVGEISESGWLMTCTLSRARPTNNSNTTMQGYDSNWFIKWGKS